MLFSYFVFIYPISYYIGYGAAKNIARQDGEAYFEDDEDDHIWSDADGDGDVISIAMKLVRFFWRMEGEFFALFVECGIKRHIEVTVLEGGFGVDLEVKMDVPDDELFHSIGFHASTANLEPTDETYTIETEKRLISESLEIVWYPSKKTPLWVVYKYPILVEKEEKPKSADIDLTELFSFSEKKIVQNESKIT